MTSSTEPNVACDTIDAVKTACETGTGPFAQVGCANRADIVTIRETFCTTGTSNIFNTSCGLLTNTVDIVNGTNDARKAACVDVDTISGRPGPCGTENSVGDSYIKAYCAVGGHADAVNNHRDCPTTAYVRKNTAATDATVAKLTSTASAGKDRALNDEGTALLTGSNRDGTVAPAFVAVDGVVATNANANFIVEDSGDDDTELDLGTATGLTIDAQYRGFLTLDSLDTAYNEGGIGFAVARGDFASGNNLYVGLLSGTDLGAPEPMRTDTVKWKALLLAMVGVNTPLATPEFDLEINFGAKTFGIGTGGTGTVSITNLQNIRLHGRFTDNGVIYGTTSVSNPGENLGTLTGLIGADGAVGIFRGNVGGSFPYVGGFVAAPALADVTAVGFINNARTGSNGQTALDVLATASPDESNAGTVNFIEGDSPVLQAGTAIAHRGELLLTTVGTTQGGVAFTFGDAINSGTANYHVGILTNTNVGPALNRALTGDWNGKIQGILDGAISDAPAQDNIKFTVDFLNNSFKVKDATTTTISDAFGTVSVGGKFLANGVVYGTIDFTGTTATAQGTITGLIGQDALVGAFKGAGDVTNKPYVGGFTATAPGNTAPPSEALEVNCEDELGANPFDGSCDDPDEEDLQVQLCTAELSKRSPRLTNFNIHCVTNERVTSLVCTDTGKRANPFHPTLCTTVAENPLNQKKKTLLRTAATLTL